MQSTSLFSQTNFQRLAFAIILLAGLSIRLLDLTDLPLDFHPTRQLFSAVKARGMYAEKNPSAYTESQRTYAIKRWKQEPTIEPPIIETLSAWTYQLSGEKLWVGRIYSILFWLLGGVAIFYLVKKMFAETPALITFAFFLLLPYGVIASRSFQPDPLMVALMCVSLWAFYMWLQKRSMKWALLAGLLSGLTLLVKNVSVFPLLGAYALALLFSLGFKQAIKDKQVWALGLVTTLPIALYLIYGLYISNFLGGQISFRFFPNMWLTPAFYYGWILKIHATVSLPACLLALLGVWFAGKERPLLAGLWLGYAAYGFTFPYHFTTHDYYQLSLIPIVAISLGAFTNYLLKRYENLFAKTSFAYALVFLSCLGLIAALLTTGRDLLSVDYRPQEKMWRAIADQVHAEGDVVALTSDYGQSLSYFGWQISSDWLHGGDLEVRELAGRPVDDFQKRFAKEIKNKNFFLITDFEGFALEVELQKMLTENYPVIAEDKGYIIFDLTP